MNYAEAQKIIDDHKTDAIIEMEIKYRALLIDLMDEHRIASEKLTKDQFAMALRQAIASGDFERHVIIGTDRQSVVYIPYREKHRLECRIKLLEDTLEFENIQTPTGYES